MKTASLSFALLTALSAAGCSSLPTPSLPSLPSMSWFSSAPQADPTVEALFEEGTRYFNEKKYVRAINAFSKIKTDHPFSPLLTQTELKIADAYYLNQQYPEAINAFKEFQSMHPTNENIPFVTYRLGQSYFDQFSSTDRDQKNTEIAKEYFETVITKHPKSPYAAEAKEKLAKCIEYISEHDFNVAYFYLQQENYPAARDRFEEIVRRYNGTPTAAKSLFYLGESYKREKNTVRAALAYEALMQHYPQSKFAAEAKSQMAQLEKEKTDPLAMLLMRDRRPAALPETTGTATVNNKLKDVELIAKKDVVFEEPGDDKSIFRRVVDTINPFSSDDAKKKEQEKAPESWQDLMVTKKAAEKKEESPGFLTGLWSGINPFAGGAKDNSKKVESPKDAQLVNRIDDSLQQKGVDTESQMAALKPPAAALPELPAPPKPTMDTGKLIGEIDANLKKSGKEVTELTPPEAAEAFKNPAAVETAVAAKKQAAEPQGVATSGLLSSIDQKLKKQGVEPANFAAPPAPPVNDIAAKKEPPKKVEIEPKLTLEKGPLFLGATETQGITAEAEQASKQEKKPEGAENQPENAAREFPKTLVKGPNQIQAAVTPKPAEPKPAAAGEEKENKGVFNQLRQDMESISKVLNPFQW